MKIGFLINPISGMGGRVGLKGTNGVLARAIALGAKPIAQERALEAITRYVELIKDDQKLTPRSINKVIWFTCNGPMGEDILVRSGIAELSGNEIEVVNTPQNPLKTKAEDTIQTCKQFVKESLDLILFCGGDGTARDIFSVVGDAIPMLGIPAGVKMHSGIFAIHPHLAGDIIVDYLKGNFDTISGEILDLDEELYRKGKWHIRLIGIAKTPHDPTFIQHGKQILESATEDEIKEEIAEFISEEMVEQSDTLFILGPGSTVEAISKHLNLKSSLLGIDAVVNKQLVGLDLNEDELLKLMENYSKMKLILSPIGAQGFILGRGNLQLSSKVIRKIGIDNIIVVSTPAKLKDIEFLKVDTADRDLDMIFSEKGYLMVVIGYRQMKLKKVGI